MTVKWKIVLTAVVLLLVIGVAELKKTKEPPEDDINARDNPSATSVTTTTSSASGPERPSGKGKGKVTSPVSQRRFPPFLNHHKEAKKRTCCASEDRMDGKIVIITGANTGIGKETAKRLARLGDKVILACRNTNAADMVKAEIRREYPKVGEDNIITMYLDLSDYEVIRQFAGQFASYDKVDVLIHNAGMARVFSGKFDTNGVEITMKTNYYGPYLLTHLLIDKLKAAAKASESREARIVVVSSLFHRYNMLNVNDLEAGKSSIRPAYSNYCNSKLANILFTIELSERLKGTGVTCNALHPGMVNTDIWRAAPRPFRSTTKLFAKTFFKTPEEGAQTTICLAIDKAYTHTTGKYFVNCKEKELSKKNGDVERATTLWEKTAEYVGLGAHEKAAIPPKHQDEGE